MRDRLDGVDAFRLIAAFMVVAIHTFPFSSIAPILDELITLTIFRIAVPFFFMTTGYFLIGPYSKNTSYYFEKKIHFFLVKISQIYLLAIVIYLPFSILNGTITADVTLFNLMRLVLIDGSFYHLWYFPGILVGTILIRFLLKSLSFNQVMSISSVLYVIGLLGDSWYGVIKSVPFLVSFYDILFHGMEMTRNGFFFTPLFLCLGAYIYRHKEVIDRDNKELNLFLVITVIMMLVESFFLHQVFTVRHDSMYLLLPSVMYFLFLRVINWQPKIKISQVQEISLIIYLIHPLVIIGVHYVSNKLLFIKFSIIYYLIVVLISYLASKFLIALIRKKSYREKQTNSFRAEREISSHAVEHNIEEIKKVIPEKTDIIAVVKANAYGTDMISYAKLLAKNKIEFFAVATIDEAIALRRSMVPGNILILGYTDIKRYQELIKYDLIQSVGSEEYARILARKKQPVRCHIQVDTGMHRLGMKPDSEMIASLYQLPYLKIEGIYSHLGSSDSLDELAVTRTEAQLSVYCHLLNELKGKNISYGMTHIQSSYGILNYPEYQFDAVRAGIIMYGFLSSNEPVKQALDLKPVIKIKAKVISKKWIKAGEYLGYGTDTILKKETLIGVVSIGYADGLPRSLSQADFGVEYQDYFLPQIGKICMDMMLIDLSQVERIQIGEEVTVVSDFQRIASLDHTITNETLSQLGQRLSTFIQ